MLSRLWHGSGVIDVRQILLCGDLAGSKVRFQFRMGEEDFPTRASRYKVGVELVSVIGASTWEKRIRLKQIGQPVVSAHRIKFSSPIKACCHGDGVSLLSSGPCLDNVTEHPLAGRVEEQLFIPSVGSHYRWHLCQNGNGNLLGCEVLRKFLKCGVHSITRGGCV